MNMRKIGLVILMLTSFVLVLAGCNSNNNADATTDNNGKVVLTLWNTWVDEAAEGPSSKARVKAFNESQDEVEIKLKMTPHDQYKTKLKTQAAGKELPDLFQVWPGAELQPLVEGGVVKPIDSIKDNWSDLIDASILQDFAVDGKQYAIPGNISFTSLIYYDKDELAKAGFNQFPTTYKELKQLIKQLKKSNQTPIELGNKGQWVLQSCYISTIADRITGSEFLQNALNGDASFTDKGFIQSLDVIKELTDMGAFNKDMNTLDDIEAREQFAQGNAAMVIGGSWNTAPLLEAIPDNKNVGVAAFPAIEGGKGDPKKVSGVSSNGIALNSDLTDEQTKAAYKFLKFFYSDEMYQTWLKDGILVPAKIDVPDGIDPITKQVMEVTSGGVAPVYDAVLSADMTSTINNGLQAITTGSTTSKKLAKKMESEVK